MKTAVVTGGTRGIGAALVRAFLREGWNVAYSGTSQETIGKSLGSLQGQFPGSRYAAFRCDVAVEDDLTGIWDGAALRSARSTYRLTTRAPPVTRPLSISSRQGSSPGSLTLTSRG